MRGNFRVIGARIGELQTNGMNEMEKARMRGHLGNFRAIEAQPIGKILADRETKRERKNMR